MIYEPTENFYNQKMHLTNIREPRFEFFAQMCRGRKVMHVGCADAMAFKEDSNLHIHLSRLDKNTVVEGLDINVEAIKVIEAVCPGTYFTAYDQINGNYDIVLVPEVMEHIYDVNSFLKEIFSIASKEYIITVPSVYAAQIFCDDAYSLEMVHPDHKYWFSPYTLYNVVKPFTDNCLMKMYYLENKSQIGIRIIRK